MPICIECRSPVTQLYTTYSKADDRSLGKGVRLTQCPRCKQFADKYVEHDFVVLFIDLVLIKPQVYRHLLFNRLGRENDQFDPSIIRLGVLLLLFDVYLTWARIEKATPNPISGGNNASAFSANLLSDKALVLQYLFFLVLCSLETAAFHLPIRLLTTHPPPPALLFPWRPYAHPNRVSTALLVSSCTKLFPILMVIWDYDLPSSASAVSWAVLINNVAALEILLDCGYFRAGVLAAVGAMARSQVGAVLLRAVGLGEGLGGFGEDLKGLLLWLAGWIGLV